MGADEAQNLSYDEMARRYAHYKHWKDAPVTGWFRGDEARQKKMETIRKQFDKAVQERMGRLSDEDLQKTFDNTQDATERKMLGKEASKRADSEDVMGKTSSKSGKKKLAADIYARNRTWQDLADDMELIRAQRNIKADYDAKREEAVRQSVADGKAFDADEANKNTRQLIKDIEKAVKDIKKVRDDLGAEGDDDARWTEIRRLRQAILDKIHASE